MRGNPVRRLVAFLLMLCLLCAGQSVAALDCAKGDGRAVPFTADQLACAGDPADDVPTVSVYLPEIAELPGHAVMVVPKAPRLWVAYSNVASRTCAAHWLRAPAHDPPKTIRFCTLLN